MTMTSRRAKSQNQSSLHSPHKTSELLRHLQLLSPLRRRRRSPVPHNRRKEIMGWGKLQAPMMRKMMMMILWTIRWLSLNDMIAINRPT